MLVVAATVLGASVLGSLHCAAMCGGFACFAAGSPAHLRDTVRSHAMYNVGRLTSYVTLGALAGAIGAGVTQLGAMAGIGRAAAIAAGLLMVMWGATALATHLGWLRRSVRAPEKWQRLAGTALVTLREQRVAIRAFATGLLTTFLPCGWLYVFVATAGGTGSIVGGMIVMFAFWLGTVPALTFVAFGARGVLAPIARHLPAVSAAVVLAIGLLTLAGRVSHTVPHVSVAQTPAHQHVP